MKKLLVVLYSFFVVKGVYIVFIRDSNPLYGEGYCACHTIGTVYWNKEAAIEAAEEINKKNGAQSCGCFWAYVRELSIN